MKILITRIYIYHPYYSNNIEIFLYRNFRYGNGINLDVCTYNDSKDDCHGSMIENNSKEKLGKNEDLGTKNNIIKGPKLDNVNFG